jgi:pimeloyl-ACP methyl ester carboxylesterase
MKHPLSLALLLTVLLAAAEPSITKGAKSLPLPGESFQFNGRDAFVILPPDADANIPWVWYAPTLPRLPSQAEVWMFKQFLDKGIAIAGIDVGESYGSPAGRAHYSDFHSYLLKTRKFRPKPCLLARSRGGLMLYSWAVENPQSVGGVAGIYPVCNIASYPGLTRACGAYGMSVDQLKLELAQHNPIDRLQALAEASVPVRHIHGDNDRVVPLNANSAILAARYKAYGGPVELEVVRGQGHNMWPGWFQSQPLTDFVIACALGIRPGTPTPIAHWKLDDSGDVATDSIGSHHGKIVGAKSAAGRSGAALEFNRAAGDHVVIPFAPDLALSTYSVAAWVYLTRAPTFSGILGTRHGGEHTFDMKVNAAKVHGDIGDGKRWIETAVNFYANDTGSNGQGGDLALERWYHIAYVIDSVNRECRLYLDADLKKRIPFTGHPILMTPANTMHIGHSSGTEFMDGRIDELKIWSQALTDDQVRADWQAPGEQ